MNKDCRLDAIYGVNISPEYIVHFSEGIPEKLTFKQKVNRVWGSLAPVVFAGIIQGVGYLLLFYGFASIFKEVAPK